MSQTTYPIEKKNGNEISQKQWLQWQYSVLYQFRQRILTNRQEALTYLKYLFRQRSRETDFMKLAHINDHISQIQNQIEKMDNQLVPQLNEKLWSILEKTDPEKIPKVDEGKLKEIKSQQHSLNRSNTKNKKKKNQILNP